MVDRFRTDAAEICNGNDPHRPPKGSINQGATFENIRCSKPGCRWFIYERGLCRGHYVQMRQRDGTEA